MRRFFGRDSLKRFSFSFRILIILERATIQILMVMFLVLRFTSDGWCRKRLTNVEFPSILDMSDFVTGNEHRFSRYRLYAVSNHFGTMESGHYTAYCWNAPSKS